MNEFTRHPQAFPEAEAQAVQQAMQFGERLDLSGKRTEAEQFYRGLLIEHPHFAPLLHNLALLLRERGEAEEAELLLRKAMAAAPADGAVRNTLATMLQANGRFDEAEAAYREAQRLEPGVEEYHYNLGVLLEELKRYPEALAEHQAALALEPRYTRALVRIGAIRHNLGANTEALADLDRAVAANPRYYDAHYYRGSVLSRLGRHDEALSALQSADALKPGRFESILATANTLRDAGRHEQAMSAYWHLLELQPERLETHHELNRLAWASGYHDLYLRSYAYARERLGPRPELLQGEAAFRLCRDDFAKAEELLWTALRLSPANPGITGLLGQALVGQKKFEEGCALFSRAIAADPANLRHRYLLAFALLQDRQPGDALEVVEEALAVDPQDQLVLAAQALAYRELGDSRYRALVDPAYVRVYDLPPPPAFRDAESFNRVLADELDRMHTMRAEPIDQTLRGGTQSPGYLFASRSPWMQELVQQVREAVADYIRGLPSAPSHPMNRRPQGSSGEIDFSGSWSCRLASRGYHSNHVHPMGWISSAYYVRLPGGMDDARQRPGWLKFGESNLDLGELDRPDRHVEPKVGRLVLFPSYFWHGTVPFSDGGDRLTIAFDAVPKAAPGVVA